MHYDAIVIGSGQAGNPLSHNLADRGWKVALVEKEHLGGTCINTGCTPTKTMVMCAQVAHYARNAAKWGVTASDGTVDLAKIVALKNDIVHNFRSGQERKIEQRKEKLHLYRGHARFVGPHQISVGDKILEAERIVINTGTHPYAPRIQGLDQVGYLTNATIMELTELPEHLLVIGAGYIGLEFGQMFRRFGSQVTVVHSGDRLLNREDGDVAQELQKALEAEGIRFVLNANTTRVARQNGRVSLTVQVGGDKHSSGTPAPVSSSARGGGREAGGGEGGEGGRHIAKSETLTGSHLLVATGRRPNTADLGLDEAGVEVNSQGFVKVNNRLETNVPGVWALGDVKGGPAFTHISYNDFQILFANLVDGKNLTTDNRPIPYAVFTDPQLGRVGMTETEARAAGRKLKINKIPMTWVARAIERNETAGLMKIIVDAETDRVLGAAILCTEGGELIHILHTLMMAGAPYTLLRGSIYIHPTLAEGFWTLMEYVKAAQ